MIIRTATEKDISAIMSFHDKLNNYYLELGDSHLVSIASEKKLLKKIEKYIVAEENGVVIGCIQCESKVASLTLSQLWVEPEFRKNGVGSKLLTEAINRAKSQGYRTVRLVVKNVNTNAMKLYEKLGFYSGATVMYLDF